MHGQKDIIEGKGRWTEKLRNKLSEPGSPSLRPESPPPSTELQLAHSANDVIEALRDEGRKAISDFEQKKIVANRNAAITKHYLKLAQSTLRDIQKECDKRTGHDMERSGPSDDQSKYPYTCTVCGHTTGSKAQERADFIARELAKKLRDADREANIEFIPRF